MTDSKVRFYERGVLIPNPARDVPIHMKRAVDLEGIDRADMADICARLISDESARETFHELTGIEVIPV